MGFVPPAPSQSLKMCVFWKSPFNLTLKCRNTIIVVSQVLWEQCSIVIGWSRQSHAFCLWWYDNSLNTTRGQPIKRSSPLHTYWCRPTQIDCLIADWLANLSTFINYLQTFANLSESDWNQPKSNQDCLDCCCHIFIPMRLSHKALCNWARPEDISIHSIKIKTGCSACGR